MRLLYIVEDYDPTFASMNVGTLIQVAREEGWAVDILTTRNSVNDGIQEMCPGVPLIKLERAKDILRHLLNVGRDYQLVLSYNTRRHNIVLPWLRWRHGVGSIIKLDRHVGWTRGSLRASARAHLVVRRPLESAKAVLVESPEVEGKVRSVAPRARTVRFPNCVSDALETFRARSGDVPRERTILYVGRISPEKGVDILVEAFALLAAAHPDWRLAIVGPPRHAEHVRSLHGAIERSGLGDRVEFVGERYGSQLYAHFVKGGIFCLPSRQEGMSNVLTEAMAFGMPIVATRVGEVGYQLQDGACGLITPSGDAKPLASALDALMRDPQLRDRLGRAARRRVEAEFLLVSHRAALKSVFAPPESS